MEILVIEPDYYNKFECIGSECEDTCCARWTVTIDKKTYKEYKKTKNKEFAKRLNRNIEKIDDNQSNNNYAKFVMDNNARCTLLNEKNLCDIYIELGESKMCNTCKMYPRMSKNNNGILEKSLVLSCPEVARLVLLNENPISFYQHNENIKVNSNDFIQTLDNEKKIYFNEIRVFIIDLMQTRYFTISQRMIILGMFIEDIDKSNNDSISGIIQRYINDIKECKFDNFLDEFNNMHTNGINQIRNFALVNNNILKEKFRSNERYTACINTAYKVYKFDEMNLDEISEIYCYLKYDKHSKKLLKYEYILENYLVNYIYSYIFPFRTGLDIYDNYVGLVHNLSMLSLIMLAIIEDCDGENIEEEIVKLFQSYCKSTEHDISILSKFIEHAKSSDFYSLGNIIKVLI